MKLGNKNSLNQGDISINRQPPRGPNINHLFYIVEFFGKTFYVYNFFIISEKDSKGFNWLLRPFNP